MDFPVISDAQIQAMAGERSFERGLEYFESGMVESVLQRGNLIQAVVCGSEDYLYDVAVHAQTAEQLSTQCTCPYDYGPICKHSVAVLLFLLYCPEQVVQRPPIRATLDELDDSQIRSLLLDVAEQHPEITTLVEQHIERLGF